MRLPARRYWSVNPSASYRQVDTVMGCHQYTISGYNLARSLGTGTRLCSDFFEVAGQMFRSGRLHGTVGALLPAVALDAFERRRSAATRRVLPVDSCPATLHAHP